MPFYITLMKMMEGFHMFDAKERYPLDEMALKSMYGEGYTDISGEWNSIPGKYYAYLQRSFYAINHNYEVRICRIKKEKWQLRIYLCLTASNSKEIQLLDKTLPTLKEAKTAAIPFVLEYDASEKATEDIEQWKSRHASPVFIVKTDGEPLLIGTTYNYIGNDSLKTNDAFTYYNEDIPDYHRQLSRPFYQICKSFDKLYLYSCNITPYGYHGSGEQDEVLLEKMLEVIRPIPKYKHIFQFLEECKKKVKS